MHAPDEVSRPCLIVYLPALHKPSFLRSIAQNLHYKDIHFGALVLAVCALGARISDDPRVYEDDVGVLGSQSNDAIEQSAGWKWIRQIQPVKRTFSTPSCIYEIQLYSLYIIFMQATSTPESCWVLVSIGVRLAQDVGAHRKKGCVKPTLETELWKRAFWMLYIADIFTSAVMGRPRCINTEDFDVELPCNECWEDQQPGQPSSALYFVCLIKLMDVLGLVMRTIYAVKLSSQYAIRTPDMWTTTGVTRLQWNEKIVAQLDSSLNKWVDEIPEHLRWDPNKENTEYFHQSVVLYTTYYWVQVQVHRPFIPRSGNGSILSFPSLAICANASRSCYSIMEVQRRRNIGLLALPNVMMALYSASMVLLVNVWRGRRLKSSTSVATLQKELVDVYQCINLLSLYEKRWQQAGRFCDTLREIISSRFHHGQRFPELRSTQRSRETALNDDSASTEHRDREIASSHPVSMAGQSNPGTQSQVRSAVPIPDATADLGSYNTSFILPTHTQELGSLPIYESEDWNEQWLLFNSQTQHIRGSSNPNPDIRMMPTLTPDEFGSNSNLTSMDIDMTFPTAKPALTLFIRAHSQQCWSRCRFWARWYYFKFLVLIMLLAEDFPLVSGNNKNFGHTNFAEALTGVTPNGMNFDLGNGTFANHSLNPNLPFYPSTATNDSEWDDWDSYMASVDEILRNINPSL
ncbi:hypothetical protein BT96DRAFT_981027 [Gymnopus androsaceus JB14]|uniref:Xylanolytic transcriptional activator regulatory domain-containing protein n=1 Tax=Gymnopus androsaceus JB14 TaxID=1447944 RepID=A0A6A4GS02_9AGAR|nr:hypothetical protein BT96DRAFT_981027 [Gymnopus androsaceus JB14]